MKEVRSFNQSELMQKLMIELKFPVDNSFIKQRIESLIERDYIKRSNTDASILEYIAWN